MSARSKKTRLPELAGLAAILFCGVAGAAPTWLECSGEDKRFSEKRVVNHTIQVMFDEQSRSILVKDSAFANLQAEKVEITPAAIQGSAPAFSIGMDRNAGTFAYARFTNHVNTSYMSGSCKLAPNPPQQKF